MEKRRNFKSEEKAKIVIEVLREEKRWMELEKVKQSFDKEKDELLRQIGQLSYEVTWLKKLLPNLNPVKILLTQNMDNVGW